MRRGLAKFFHGLGNISALGYDAGDSIRTRRDLGWDRSTPRDEENTVARDGTRETMRLKATDLARNNPVVAGIGNRIALFTVGDGILPQVHTDNPEWSAAAEDWFIDNYARKCDSRGRASLFDLQRMAVSLRPIHGGLYLEQLSDGSIRPIECERIRQPTDPKTAEAYVDGVRVDKSTGRIVSYWVHSRDSKGGFSEPHPEASVPAENILRVIRPPWRIDQVREIPDLAPVIPALWDVAEMNTHTLNTAKVQSMIIGALKKNNGMGLNALPRATGDNPQVGKRQTFSMDWGQIYEMFPGEDMDLKVSPTPGAQHIPYVKFQYALCAAALGFPYEFLTLDLSGLDFSRQKGMLLLVNHAIRAWRCWLVESMMQPLWCWRVAMAIRNGDLPPAPVDKDTGASQWCKVKWQGPEEPWIDRQEAMQADILEIQAGLGTFSHAAKRRGQDLETIYRQKADDFLLAQAIADEKDVPLEEITKMQIPGQTDKATGAPVPEEEPDAKEPDDDDMMEDAADEKPTDQST